MNDSRPSENFPVGVKSGSSMMLSLNGTGDPNGNAFPISFATSSLSPPYLGESSPDSLRSLSSLSGSHTDSPVDYDMLEVTMTITTTDKMTDVAISKWLPEEHDKGDAREDVDNDNASLAKLQSATELSESNDNSASLYLDADCDECCNDTLNDNDDNLALTLSLTGNSHLLDSNDLCSAGGIERRQESFSLEFDMTEIQAGDGMDDTDEEEEASFLSVSSSVTLDRSSMTLTSTSGQPSEALFVQANAEPLIEEQPADEAVDNRNDSHIPAVQNITECPSSEDLEKTCQMSTSVSDSTNPMSDFWDSKFKSPSLQETERSITVIIPALPKLSQSSKMAKAKPAITKSAVSKGMFSTTAKPLNHEAKRVSTQSLKNVKSTGASRPTLSLPKTPSQNKSVPGGEKRGIHRKENQQIVDVGKRQRSSAGQNKPAVVVKPPRSRNVNHSSLKTNQNTISSQPEKEGKMEVVVGALCTSFGLGVAEKHLLNSAREEAVSARPVMCVAGKPDESTGCGSEDSNKAADEEPEKDHSSDTMEVTKDDTSMGSLMTAPEEKPKNQSMKVSSKLGPNTRQQGKGAPGNKGAPGGRCASGSNPVLSSGTGPPGQGNLGLLPVQTEVSEPEKDGQCGGSGSPTRTKQNQVQIQGIPKARTVTERASGLATPGSMTPSLKPFANQLPGSGSGGRSGGPASSKLPVKGLSAILSSSAPGSNSGTTDSGGTVAVNKAPTTIGPPEIVGAKSDDRLSRSTLPMGNQNVVKPPSSPTTAFSNTIISANSNATTPAATKVPGMRSRALSLQARTTATGLKAPAVTNHIVAKTLATNQGSPKAASQANQTSAKQTQYHLQRSGSAKFSRLNNAVDKNKPRGAPARPVNANAIAPPPTFTSGSNQNQLTPELLSDLINSNAPATSVFPISTSETTNSVGSTGTTGTSISGFRARASSRSNPKTCSRLQNGSGPASKPKAGEVGGGCVTVADQGSGQLKQDHLKEQAEKKNQRINQLRKLLAQGNKRVEALATVIQHLFSEREETLKEKKGLSLEIAHLRDELVLSSQSCARLQTEKEEARVSLEEMLKRLKEQHKDELAQLEDRLRNFYQTEWDKVHQAYQEEADKYRTLMEQQVEELRNRQEAERKNQEVSHSQKMESLKLQYETSIEELKRTQLLDLESLEKTLKETEASLSEKIAELSSENEALSEKLRAEEERRKRILSDKNLKDSHTVYLEQELESLKVVLEIKNTQLHQKEKKLMEMDKLVESNVKLEECLTRVQQENEDYKARMDKHAALSKQLSSEQAMLQQTLQKESKVNKRLSMENEELLWKLHNGDLLASPRRLSPTSPQSSAYFPTSTTLSPR